MEVKDYGQHRSDADPTEQTIVDLRRQLIEMRDQLHGLEGENQSLRRLLSEKPGQTKYLNQGVLEQYHDGVCLVNEQGRVILWNRSMAEMTGLLDEDVLGRLIWDVQFQMMPEESKNIEAYANLKSGLSQYLQTGQAPWSGQQMEREYLRPDGSQRFIEGRVFPIETDSGFMLASISQDISERKQVEQSLIQAENMARSTLDGLSAHIAIIDQTGKILAVNQAWREFSAANGGDSRKTNEGSNYLQISEYAEELNSGEGKAFANGIRAVLDGWIDNFEMEYPCHTKDQERWFVGRVTRFPAGGSPKAVIAHEDVSERKLGEEALRHAHKQLTTLLEISQSVVSTLDLDELLDMILAKLASVVRYSGAAVMILEENELIVQAYRGPALPVDPTSIHIPLRRFKEINRLISTGQPFFIRDLKDFPRMMAEIHRALDQPSNVIGRFRSWLVVPLMVKGIQIGNMMLAHRKPNYYDRSSREMVQMFANHVAIAIHNARLYHKAQTSAILEERNRLARELHDSVAQALYSITLYANATRRALSANKMNVAGRHLEELQRSSSEAVADMRLLIFELRPPVLDDEGLIVAIRNRLEMVEARAGLQVNLQVEGELRISKAMETEVYRIVQEALNNVLKHAQATRVEVKIKGGPEQLELMIWDDGKGFEVAILEKSWGLGFRNIRERIQRMGGEFWVESAPGKGTAIYLEVR